jgi:hypothetical protein
MLKIDRDIIHLHDIVKNLAQFVSSNAETNFVLA